MVQYVWLLPILINLVSSVVPTLEEYERAKDALKDVLPRGADLPKAVRLAFHDCVGPDGCDGCLNIDDSDNNGLSEIVDRLSRVKAGSRRVPGFDSISNADFWQIAGIAALELANPLVDVTFKGGRIDCSDSPGDIADHTYPNPNMNRTEMLDWFGNSPDGFGMNAEQVTALMGAHSLGRARTENTGYNGAWTPSRENTFDNEFYQLLVDQDIEFRNRANLAPVLDGNGDIVPMDYKYQWTLTNEEGTRFTMLNTDMELAYNIDVDNFGSGTGCEVVVGYMEDDETSSCVCSSQPSNCNSADTFDLVQTYANDEERFLEDFKAVYELMMEKGNQDLIIPA